MCNKILEERADVPKAFFRRGEALVQLKDYELAMNDFHMVIELDPENKAARNKVSIKFWRSRVPIRASLSSQILNLWYLS